MSYKELRSYQTATIIYDFTAEFCERYVKPGGRTDRPDKSDRLNQTNQTDRTYRSYRTADQMLQAARSGKQNIVEGSTERTSKKNEIKLLGVSRASFQELLEDYEDFLRQRGLRRWSKDEPEARAVRALAHRTDKTDQSDRTYQTYRTYLAEPKRAANCAICLVNQANFLLDRQIKSLEEKFIKDGGWTEMMRQKRIEERKKQILKGLGWN